MFIKFRALLFLLLIAFPANALAVYSLPADLDITFDPGIPGGIPERPASGKTTISVESYGAVADDATSDSGAIASALGAATAGDVVQFGNGEYTLTTSMTIPEGVTLRGNGMDITTLKYTGTGIDIIIAGLDGACAWNDKWCVQVPLSVSGLKGDTELTIDSGDGDYTSFNAGDIIVVAMSNAGLDWVVQADSTWNALVNDIDGGAVNYVQTVEVVSRSGNTLIIDTPLYVDMPTTQNAFVGKDSTDVYKESVGLENFTLTRTQNPGLQASMIRFTHMKYSWVKGVEVDTGFGRMINFIRCYRSVIQENYVHHGFVYTSGALNYHYVLGAGSARCLVTNNVSLYTNKSMQIESTGGGNVISYNYFDGSWVNEGDPYWQGQDIGSHAAHSHHELIEGNWFNKFNMDAIHGSSSHFVLFRNYIDSDHEFTIAQPDHIYQDIHSVAAIQSDLGYYLSVVGNILGKDGRSNIYECNPSSNCSTGEGNNHIYMFRTSDNTAPSPYSTVLRHANYDYYNDSIIYNGSDDTALPDSMYLASAPSWWDDQGAGRPWPPVNPTTPESVVDIPAKDRFEGQMFSAAAAASLSGPQGARLGGAGSVTIQ